MSLRNTLRTLFVIGSGLLVQAGTVHASAFKVTPVRVQFDGPSSTLLTLKNDSEEALRFQISAFAWSQDANGGIKLDSTEDVTFFPALLTLKPGEERKVRVATTVTPKDVEKTYRIFFDELPPLDTPKEKAGAQVRILTRMGIPIFVTPSRATAVGVVENLKVQNGHVVFDVRNNGNMHFAVQSLKVRAAGASGEPLFDKQLEGWYILPGSPRTYDVEIPDALCSKVKSVALEVQTDIATAENAGALTSQVQTAAGSCK
jgi:fimbrial chaperone protein